MFIFSHQIYFLHSTCQLSMLYSNVASSIMLVLNALFCSMTVRKMKNLNSWHCPKTVFFWCFFQSNNVQGKTSIFSNAILYLFLATRTEPHLSWRKRKLIMFDPRSYFPLFQVGMSIHWWQDMFKWVFSSCSFFTSCAIVILPSHKKPRLHPQIPKFEMRS